jgi:copper chaperone CopZ
MKKTFNIEVDCANCANKIEISIQKIAGVNSAVINFMTQKLIIEIDDNKEFQTVMKNVLAEFKKIEPDSEINF